MVHHVRLHGQATMPGLFAAKGGLAIGKTHGKKKGKLARNRYRNRELYQKYIAGQSQRELAAEYKLSQPQISIICGEVEGELTQDLASEMWRIKARHVERLVYLYTESVRKWEESEKTPRDAAYVREARKSLDSLERVLGLKAPTQIDISGQLEVDHEHDHEHTIRSTLSPEQRRIALSALLNCFTGRKPVGQPGEHPGVNGATLQAPNANPPGANGVG